MSVWVTLTSHLQTPVRILSKDWWYPIHLRLLAMQALHLYLDPHQTSTFPYSVFPHCDTYACSDRSPCFHFEPLGLSRCTAMSCVAICLLLYFLLLYSICPSSFLMSSPCSRTFHDWHSPRTLSHLELYLHSPAGCALPPSVNVWLCQHLHMPPITSMPPFLSHVFMFIVLVLFLDISCAHDSFLSPWRRTHWRPLTHTL
jgi:hypothetical protein